MELMDTVDSYIPLLAYLPGRQPWRGRYVLSESKLALHVESSHAGIDGAAAQLFLDAQQLVVLCHTLGAAGCAGLDRKSTRLNSSHITRSRMPSSA